MVTHSNRIIHQMEIRRIFEDMLKTLEPWDMPILALRLEGIQSPDIARLLGISRTTLYALDNELKARIQKQVPEAWELISDLRRRSGRPDLPDALERGWVGAPAASQAAADEPQCPDPTPPPPEKNRIETDPTRSDPPPKPSTQPASGGPNATNELPPPEKNRIETDPTRSDPPPKPSTQPASEGPNATNTLTPSPIYRPMTNTRRPPTCK